MRVKRSSGVPSPLQGPPEALGELVEAAEGDLGHQGVAAAEMAVERRRRDAHELGRIGEGETAEPALRDEALRRLDQRLLQIAVMIALPVERGRASAACRVSSCSARRTLKHGRGEEERRSFDATASRRASAWFHASTMRSASDPVRCCRRRVTETLADLP